MVVFLGIRAGQVPEEPQPEGLDPFRDWQAVLLHYVYLLILLCLDFYVLVLFLMAASA